VRIRLGVLRKLVARLRCNADSRRPAKLQKRFHPPIPPRLPLPSHTDMIELPRTRAYRLFHRVQAVQNFHLFSLPAIPGESTETLQNLDVE